MSASNLEELLVDLLADTLDAERQVLKALPEMAKAATDEELQTAFAQHRTETVEQVSRLEKIFALLGKSLTAKKCLGMQGLLEEGQDQMEEDSPESVMDAALIAAAQKVEHYEIAAYGTMATYAEILDLPDVLALLKSTLDEEKAADETLSRIATTINFEAQEAF